MAIFQHGERMALFSAFHSYPGMRGAINKKGFSFIKFLETPANFPTELHEWINRSFIAFRELQVCMMENFRPLFNSMRTQRDMHSGTQEVNELEKGAGTGFSV